MENKRGKIDSDCKVISIIQGEEYKEKLECEIRKTIFFMSHIMRLIAFCTLL